ncbi:MAG TPA: permease [Anaerolineales bacterium]|nr:permease [Anaerolineales bacterium]HNB87471.1 permease [Anaerolineales bacterium]HNC88104.1 permease [Anaerolineales bacterium]HND92673.1 permease [Anaerolineales bacterium]HNE68394.1 permease [Anaerolineales bacterium]
MTTLSSPSQSHKYLPSLVFFSAVIWLIAYNTIQPLADWISYTALGLARDSRLGESLAFFLYDVPKILLLLSGMVFLISIVRTFFSPERTRALLGGKREGVGNIFAAMLGIVTPFCSCSAVPLFIGFVESGIPLGVTFSFLIAAPTINEVAVILLFGLFGWKVAGLYVASGLVVAIVAGFIIGRLKMERYVADFVWKVQRKVDAFEEKLTWEDRIERAWDSVKEIVGKVWLYVVVGIAIGAGIHGYVPEDAMASILGKQAWWSVPVAVLIGIPLYSNAAGIVPIVGTLIEKGASVGTALAFMMSVIGLSLPEAVILKRVLKMPLLVTFFAVIAVAIMITGYMFNLIL